MHLQTAEIERRIEQETKAEKHIQKLLLLGEYNTRQSFLVTRLSFVMHTIG